jgi:hypothetical protein
MPVTATAEHWRELAREFKEIPPEYKLMWTLFPPGYAEPAQLAEPACYLPGFEDPEHEIFDLLSRALRLRGIKPSNVWDDWGQVVLDNSIDHLTIEQIARNNGDPSDYRPPIDLRRESAKLCRDFAAQADADTDDCIPDEPLTCSSHRPEPSPDSDKSTLQLQRRAERQAFMVPHLTNGRTLCWMNTNWGIELYKWYNGERGLSQPKKVALATRLGVPSDSIPN